MTVTTTTMPTTSSSSSSIKLFKYHGCCSCPYGKFVTTVVILLTSAAFLLTDLLATSSCNFITLHLNADYVPIVADESLGGDDSSTTKSLSNTLYRPFSSKYSIGIFQLEKTIFDEDDIGSITTQCKSPWLFLDDEYGGQEFLPNELPNIIYDQQDDKSIWKLIRITSIVSSLLGLLFTILVCVTSCCTYNDDSADDHQGDDDDVGEMTSTTTRRKQQRCQPKRVVVSTLLAVLLLTVIPTFHGISFIVFGTSLCRPSTNGDDSIIDEDFTNIGQKNDDDGGGGTSTTSSLLYYQFTLNGTCSIGTGGILMIIGTILWYVAIVVVVTVVVLSTKHHRHHHHQQQRQHQSSVPNNTNGSNEIVEEVDGDAAAAADDDDDEFAGDVDTTTSTKTKQSPRMKLAIIVSSATAIFVSISIVLLVDLLVIYNREIPAPSSNNDFERLPPSQIAISIIDAYYGGYNCLVSTGDDEYRGGDRI